jgi:phosphopantetheinyl transferase
LATDETAARPVARIAVARIDPPRPDFPRQREAAELLLRHLLALSFPGREGAWRLIRLSSGAPRLQHAAGTGPRLRVSLSHRGGWVAAGFTGEAALGIDVETARPGRDTTRLAAFLGWDSCTPTEAAFYRRWVLWEAYCKCREGRLFDVAGPEFEILAAARATAAGGCWQAFDLELPAGAYAAAVLRTKIPRELTLCAIDSTRPLPW